MTKPQIRLGAQLRRSVLAVVAALVATGAPAQETLELREAIEMARAANETPAIARARIAQAQAVRRAAISTLIPGLTLGGAYTRRAREVTREVGGDDVTIQERDAFNWQGVLATTLFDARAFPLVKSANTDLEAQILESSELERELDFNVAQAFVEVLSAERLRDASARRIQVAEAVLADASLRRDAGLAAVNDVTRSDLELANARLTLTQAENLVRSARLGLGYLVGSPVDGLLAEPPPVDHPALEAAALVERAGAARADLQALEKRAIAFRQRARAPRLGIVPTLGMAATQRYTNEAGLSGNNDDWNVGATLTWEIFDGGTRYAVADQLEAQALEAELDSAALRRRIDLEVRSALADLASASAAVDQTEVQRRVAAQNAEEVRERFVNGLATALEQADATVAAFAADADAVRARLARALATLSLRRALGDGPLGPEEPSPQAIEETR